jgi:hypothetical protein
VLASVKAGRYPFSLRHAACVVSLIVRPGVPDLQHCKESFLRNIHATHTLHPLFAFLLFLEQLPLAADIAAVALRDHVFPDR